MKMNSEVPDSIGDSYRRHQEMKLSIFIIIAYAFVLVTTVSLRISFRRMPITINANSSVYRMELLQRQIM